jgi:RHS repeat-associated protein
LETGLISPANKSVPPTSGLASIESISYDSAGNLVTANANEPSIPGDRYKFVSREWNGETALQYNRTRLYDPNRGQWATQDPKAFATDDASLHRGGVDGLPGQPRRSEIIQTMKINGAQIEFKTPENPQGE